ncbi:hypothetical protein [Nonomuraea zeae]|nr:hypothetical protein [Nonomuraea zeae]
MTTVVLGMAGLRRDRDTAHRLAVAAVFQTGVYVFYAGERPFIRERA